MSEVRERAPAKVNLVLHVGPRAANGLHEVCSLFASIDLADVVLVRHADRDEVVCEPPIDGRNLAGDAVVVLREALGGDLPPLRVEIEKRIPVAAGLAGGSADAAATLRAANRIAGEPLGGDDLRRVAEQLGSDVPSQVEPRHALVGGTGERIEPVQLPPMTLALVPSAEGLSTAAVYAEADRLGTIRERLDPAALRALAALPLDRLAAALENDLEPAAVALRPELARTRQELLRGAALTARVTGSGPTVYGVFADRPAAEAAAAGLGERALVVGLHG